MNADNLNVKRKNRRSLGTKETGIQKRNIGETKPMTLKQTTSTEHSPS
jgi:hypothetical protein